jgi:hypothetical protein
MALVSLLLVGTAELIVHSIYIKKRAESNLRMAVVLCSRLENFKSIPYDGAGLQGGLFDEAFEMNKPRAIFRGEWKIETQSSNRKRIEYSLFPEDEPERVIQAGLLLLRELGF